MKQDLNIIMKPDIKNKYKISNIKKIISKLNFIDSIIFLFYLYI